MKPIINTQRSIQRILDDFYRQITLKALVSVRSLKINSDKPIQFQDG